ncbi:MAG: lysophospholipase [bacterium]|nr:lysophospholipase [bacterium]
MEKITITTEDGLKLSALLWNKEAFASVLLLHMMPAHKESWVPLADKLAETGFNVLAIDFRGHGESEGGDYTMFTPEQHQESYIDVEASVEYLKALFPHTEVSLAGASIGANMAIKYMAAHPEIGKGLALSAGLDYYGVRAIDDVQNLTESQQLLLVGARDDMRKAGSDCGTMAQQLADAAGSASHTVVYDVGGHGTDMWSAHPELLNTIIKFIAE